MQHTACVLFLLNSVSLDYTVFSNVSTLNRRYFITHKPCERFSWRFGDWNIVKSWWLTFPLSRPHWQPQEIPHPVESVCGPVAVWDTIEQLRNTFGRPEATCVRKKKVAQYFFALQKTAEYFPQPLQTEYQHVYVNAAPLEAHWKDAWLFLVWFLFNNITIRHPSSLSSSRCDRDVLLTGSWWTGLQMQQWHWQNDGAMQAWRFIHVFLVVFLRTNEANRI